VFGWYVTRVVKPDCVVAISRVTDGHGQDLSGPAGSVPTDEELIQRAYQDSVASGRCDPPLPRWRSWLGWNYSGAQRRVNSDGVTLFSVLVRTPITGAFRAFGFTFCTQNADILRSGQGLPVALSHWQVGQLRGLPRTLGGSDVVTRISGRRWVMMPLRSTE
jgi:hypothetical protein